MKIQLNKCYIRRDGQETGPIRLALYPYFDPKFGETYTIDGKLNDNEKSAQDLIREDRDIVSVWVAVSKVTGKVTNVGSKEEIEMVCKYADCFPVFLREETPNEC
jgi:hypothetical protein